MGNFKYNNNKNNNNDGWDWKKPRSLISKNHSFVDDRKLPSYQLEARFCKTVGGLSLKKVLQNQKYLFLHHKVLEWKDSAVEEAFWDAKRRFFANVHGQSCDVKLPDPDIFIDTIDWESAIDSDLLSDLENHEHDRSSETEQQGGGVIIGIPVTVTHSIITPTGWGDAEEVKPPQEHITPTGWGDAEEVKPPQEDLIPTGWGDAEEVKPPQEEFGTEHWNEYGVKKDEQGYSNGWEDAKEMNEYGVKRDERVFSSGWEDDCVYATRNMARDGENRVNVSTWNGYRNQQGCYGNGKRSEHGRHYNFNAGFNRKDGHGGWSTSRSAAFCL